MGKLRGVSELAAEKVPASTALGSPSGQQSQDVNRGEVVAVRGPLGGCEERGVGKLRGVSELAAEKVPASTALGSPSGQQSQDVNRGEVVG